MNRVKVRIHDHTSGDVLAVDRKLARELAMTTTLGLPSVSRFIARDDGNRLSLLLRRPG